MRVRKTGIFHSYFYEISPNNDEFFKDFLYFLAKILENTTIRKIEEI